MYKNWAKALTKKPFHSPRERRKRIPQANAGALDFEGKIFVSVTSSEGSPLFGGKGHFFLVPERNFNLHSRDTSARKIKHS